jgi:NTE family protein
MNRGRRAGSGPPVIGLALGGGAARGWAHLGVIRALDETGIRPGVITGTSMGAVVGALMASGRLEDALGEIARADLIRVLGYIDPAFPGSSLMDGVRIQRLLKAWFGLTDIEDLPTRFAAIAADLETGDEIVMTKGGLASAVRASISIPLVFPPVSRDGRWLVDGGLVDPVPCSPARALGADVLISVDLNSRLPALKPVERTRKPGKGRLSRVTSSESTVLEEPAFSGVLLNSLLVMHRSLALARNGSAPPDVVIAPDLSGFTGAEFHKAEELAETGYNAALKPLGELAAMLRAGGGLPSRQGF